MLSAKPCESFCSFTLVSTTAGASFMPAADLLGSTYTASSMDIRVFILSVRRMVNETDIVELELKSKRFSFSLKKKAALQAAEPIVQARSPPFYSRSSLVTAAGHGSS
jgi:hypothetical protein